MKEKAISLRLTPIRWSKLNKIVIEAITAILIIVWIYTGISKLIEFVNFRYQLSKWEYFKEYSVFISYAIPIIELLLAGLLTFRKSKIAGLWGSFILMCIFTVYVAFILSYAKTLPCTCGGIISTLNWTQHLVLNILLTAISFIAIVTYNKSKKLENNSKM